ncbi:uncharacterized protein PHACADRAFT_253221 [Phanerochaete carnosa HHB-10118-sp]|uniref:Uncharacterized protein n=1 Tax=Phanerochaete carnosa (strain HHB-10118-sp) TaxID=650164 RepID=K5W493_PHACS|nr:uncharacterized protein PHACADRAFT_253221 [Phanerochaete carnosa HHB-10118-sp]EKM58728.1 hypothetical protein PHACADRAFT_253221 [Phanerochaete carnosa HHB-10118-sp]
MTEKVLLSEEYVQSCFHSYLKSALSQAKAERLLDTELLSSAEGDLMITGPALCLYFAALRSTTNPPSVPLPRTSKSSAPPTDLSTDNCPEVFRPFLEVWATTVPSIQALAPEHQHDLARVICGLSPVARSPHPGLKAISADLRAVAIEISMRRTFQDRYASDLQAAIDAGSPQHGLSRVKASFVPPPVYEPTSPVSHTTSLHSPTPSQSSLLRSPSPSPSRSSFRSISPLPSPTILGPDSPAIELIRETLYAALADVLGRTPSLRRQLQRDPARAYFSSVALAILDISMSSVVPGDASTHTEPAIRGVLGKTLALSECPRELRPFMQELCDIGDSAREAAEDDTLASVRALSEDRSVPEPRMDRVREILRGGVGWAYDERHERDADAQGGHEVLRGNGDANGAVRPGDSRRRTTSTDNRAVAFANRINALALAMTKLRAFRERQEGVFKILASVRS